MSSEQGEVDLILPLTKKDQDRPLFKPISELEPEDVITVQKNPLKKVIYPEEFLNDMASIEAQKKTNDGESTSKQKTEQKAAVSTQKTKWRTKKDESGSDEEYPNPPLTESIQDSKMCHVLGVSKGIYQTYPDGLDNSSPVIPPPDADLFFAKESNLPSELEIGGHPDSKEDLSQSSVLSEFLCDKSGMDTVDQLVQERLKTLAPQSDESSLLMPDDLTSLLETVNSQDQLGDSGSMFNLRSGSTEDFLKDTHNSHIRYVFDTQIDYILTTLEAIRIENVKKLNRRNGRQPRNDDEQFSRFYDDSGGDVENELPRIERHGFQLARQDNRQRYGQAGLHWNAHNGRGRTRSSLLLPGEFDVAGGRQFLRHPRTDIRYCGGRHRLGLHADPQRHRHLSAQGVLDGRRRHARLCLFEGKTGVRRRRRESARPTLPYDCAQQRGRPRRHSQPQPVLRVAVLPRRRHQRPRLGGALSPGHAHRGVHGPVELLGQFRRLPRLLAPVDAQLPQGARSAQLHGQRSRRSAHLLLRLPRVSRHLRRRAAAHFPRSQQGDQVPGAGRQPRPAARLVFFYRHFFTQYHFFIDMSRRKMRKYHVKGLHTLNKLDLKFYLSDIGVEVSCVICPPPVPALESKNRRLKYKTGKASEKRAKALKNITTVMKGRLGPRDMVVPEGYFEMLPRIRTDVMAAAFLAALVLEVAAYPSPYAGFAVDDVRRPIYRGSTRYKRHSFIDIVKTDLITNNYDNDSIIFRTNQILNGANEKMPWYKIVVKRDVEIDRSRQGESDDGREIGKAPSTTDTSFAGAADDSAHKDSSENEEWEFVPLASPLLETDGHLVRNFFKNSLRILKSHSSENVMGQIEKVKPAKVKHESLDKLILSHTGGKLPIQMYPEQRPHEWDGKPKDPTVIVIEDVHPSKLPKPEGQWVNRPLDYPHVPSRPPSNYYALHSSNTQVRPSNGPGSWGHTSTQIPNKPQNGHSPIILIENVPPSTISHGQWTQYQPGSVYRPEISTKPPTTFKPFDRPVVAIGNGKPTNPQGSQGGSFQGGQISVQIVSTSTRPTVTRPTVPSYNQIENEVVYKPITLKPKPSSQKPKPIRPTLVKPVTENYPALPTFEITTEPPKVKPQHSNPKPITVKPAFLHPKPQKPIKKPNKPVIVSSNVPAYYGILGLNQDTTGILNASNTTSQPSSSLQATVIVQNNWPSLRPVYNHPTTSPPRPVQSTPIYVTTNKPLVAGSGAGGSYVNHKPVYLYPRPGPSPEPPPRPLAPIHPPLNESPRPPEAPYRDPPIKPNHPLGSAIIISQTTSLPPITPPVPVRPPAPSILILEAEPEPIIDDCGTIHIINKDAKNEKACSDVMILLNSPLAVASGASAASSGSSGVAAAGGASVAAGAAAAGAAAGAAGASLVGAAGATLAAGSAGIAALGGATAANSIGATGNSQGSSGSNSAVNGPVPLVPPVSSPALHPVEDETSSEEDYDYTDDNNNPPSPSSSTRDLKTETEVIVRSDISVAGAEDGRAASSAPFPSTTPTPMAESLKMVTKQLLQAPGATDMVATDVRTPPKVKSQVKPQDQKKEQTEVSSSTGKGEARPVAMEEASAYEIITAPPPVKQSTPPTEGLSTWILLSNAEQSTLPSNKKKTNVQPTSEPKKTFKATAATPTIEKVKRPEEVKTKPQPNKPVALPLKKQNATKEKEDPTKTSGIILQDPKFKNKTPVIVGKVPSAQNKTEAPAKKVTPQSTTPFMVMTRRKPITLSPTPPTRHNDLVPTTSLLLETGTVESADDSSTPESTTDKSTKRPTTIKKKKKNKNRRRRPSKPGAETAESKVEETSVAPNTKIDTNARPISTRIYNYLAREVMPSVGVGLVGLVLTAGLAGLFLYPFGGGIARRNYEKGSGPGPDHQMYYYNSYAPRPEHDTHSNSQPEEVMFGQVLSSMNQNTYSPSYDSNKYSTNNKYRYNTQDYSQKENDYNVNGYAGSSDYSTLPDPIKNSDYGVQTPDYSVKSPDYSKAPDYAIKPSDYNGKTDYSVHDPVKTSDYSVPEASKYYSMDPVSSHYKLTDNAPKIDSYQLEEQNYPSLTDYASYSNAAAVGTDDSYSVHHDNSKNDSTLIEQEDKSDKSQPHFSALVGSPQFTNTDFVGSVAMRGGYGAHEDVVRHRTGALAAEHGPRSLNIDKEEEKKRSRRDVHDDNFSNEIEESNNDYSYKKPSSESPVMTTDGSDGATTVKIENTSTNTGKDTDATTPSASSEDSKDSLENDSTTESSISTDTDNKKPSDGMDVPQMDHNSEGFLSFVARLAQVKLRMGITLLRTTGEALTRYLKVVTKRMEDAVRTMENRRRVAEQKRQRRDVSKPVKKSPYPRKTNKKQHHKIH
ncbi:unnamed protein product [Nesidiocoris tenuis]|uniref:Uncharacterized protein n=1 Tax=Nesidiocoris tenuis TaxID=355587 RepID=A0A6H5GWD9_9HEMI|nr:unnamed protein product [Nesidiocoris tenuis]